MDTKEKIKVMQAYAEGKPIQVREIGDADWEDTNCPIWNWHLLEYRIKPNKQPLTSADFPPGTVVRDKSISTTWYTVISVSLDKICYGDWTFKFTDIYLQEHNEYSTDQGKTWKPCYK